MGVNQERRQIVQKLRQCARAQGVPLVPDNASKAAVLSMVDALIGVPNLPEEALAEIHEKKAEYEKTWANASGSEASQPIVAGGEGSAKEWKFTAAQLTYNNTDGEWASKDKHVLHGLFSRCLTFAQNFGRELKAEHMSVKMEESEKDHVHIHVYFNLSAVFHHKGKDALKPFCFEGIHPHVVPNRASGGAFAGAVRHGHFYVVVDKIGSLFTWTDYQPFKEYPVEGWLLDNLMKQEKLTHEVYLSYAARLCVGFQRRMTDVAAAQRYLKQQAIDNAVKTEAAALEAQTLPMKDYAEVNQFLAFSEARGTGGQSWLSSVELTSVRACSQHTCSGSWGRS